MLLTGRAGPLDNDDPMRMVGHEDKRIKPDPIETIGEFLPRPQDRLAGRGWMHDSLDDLSQEAQPPLDAHRHKVGAGSRIVIARQTRRTAVMTVGIEGHGFCLRAMCVW
jgi:hypothetical protein